MRLQRVCKTYISWTPSWIYQILNDALVASLGCYKDDVCNSRISKISICMWIPGVWRSQGKFSYIFCNKLPFRRPFCLNSYVIFIFLLYAKCLQLDFNVIANNLRKKMGLKHFSISHNFLNYKWPPSWIYRNAQWCQSAITRIFLGQYMH